MSSELESDPVADSFAAQVSLLAWHIRGALQECTDNLPIPVVLDPHHDGSFDRFVLYKSFFDLQWVDILATCKMVNPCANKTSRNPLSSPRMIMSLNRPVIVHVSFS